MPILGLKTLSNTLAKVNPNDRELLSKHFNQHWEKYHNDTIYYRTLWENGQITLTQYRQIAIPKLRQVRNELKEIARLLIPKRG